MSLALVMPWNLEVAYTEEAGRVLRATKDFAVGDLIVEDVGATVVLTGTQLGEVYCHVCYEPSAKLTCKGCQLFATCPTCARVALRPHQERCAAFAKFADLAKESSTDLDMLRLLAQVLFTAVEARREKSMQQQQGDVATVTAAMTATTTKDDPSRLPINKDKVSLLNGLDELIVDRNAFAPAWHTSIRQGCAALLALMRTHFPGEIQPEDGDEGFAGYGLDALCDMAIRVNLASFGLPDREGRNRTFAVGLFPVMGLLNHSCAPKAVFTASKGGRMALRAVRAIPRGEEVTTSYIDLFNSRDDRRRDLMHTKHFFCMCARCTDEQYERFPADRFLDHPLCPRCREDVAVPEIFAVQPLDEDDDDENYFYAYAEAHGGHAKGHASASNCESRDCTHAPPSSRPARHRRLVETYRCYGCKAELPSKEVERPIDNCATEISIARRFYYQGRYAEAAHIYDHVFNAYDGKKRQVHPYNSILFDSLTPLINCYNRLGELQNSAAMLRKLIEVISSNPAIAEHHPEKADFYWNLGDVLLSLIEQRGPSLPKKMVARYRQEARESFEKAAQIRTVCYGAQHPTTLAAVKAVGRS